MSPPRPSASAGRSTRADPATAPSPVYLVTGEDASLVGQAARTLIEALTAGRDASLVVEEHGAPSVDDLDIGVVLDACTTPPFLVDRRVVVVREAGRLGAREATRLLAVLESPVDGVVLVLVGGGGTVPAALVKAVAARGGVVETAVGTGRARTSWVAERVSEGPVRLDGPARSAIEAHLGDDLGRLSGILDMLASAYGQGAAIGIAELEPFLGEAGSVPPWDLTDAIDSGATAPALVALHRLLGPGGRAAPELVAVLHRHFSNMLRLDGAGARSGEDAAQLLGVRSPFVAKKALSQGQRLGSERLGQAVALVAEADVDVKGRTALAPELVLEVLVARLTRLARGASAAVGRR
jgi:DNA polymerase-3 subunit delta